MLFHSGNLGRRSRYGKGIEAIGCLNLAQEMLVPHRFEVKVRIKGTTLREESRQHQDACFRLVAADDKRLAGSAGIAATHRIPARR